ncbi:MAG: M23/M56 family metallopeptidase [Bacteroidota bacterium]
MMPLLFSYLLASTLCLSGMYGCYMLFFHGSLPAKWNRWILLGTVFLSLVLPANTISIEVPVSMETVSLATPLHTWLPKPNLSDSSLEIIQPIGNLEMNQEVNIWIIFLFVYMAGLGMLAIQFLKRIRTLGQLIYESSGNKYPGYTILYQEKDMMPYSFWRYVFVNEDFEELPKQEKEWMLTHELVHIRNLHSLDILLLELMRIVFWFNPLLPLITQRLKEVHEYIADEETVQDQYVHAYARLLVHSVGTVKAIPFVNGFAQSMLSKRVQRLLGPTKVGSKKLALLIPIIGLFVFTFSCDVQPIPRKADSITELKPEIVLPKSSQSLSIEEDVQVNYLPAIKPIKGQIYSGFGMRMHPVFKIRKRHTGIDFSAEIGTPVHATADGVIDFVGTNKGGYGIYIDILHEKTGFKTRYAHLSKGLFSKDQHVKRGDIIGFSGNSGLSTKPHLHYEVMMKDSSNANSWIKKNPADYFPIDMVPEQIEEKIQASIIRRSVEDNMSMD